MSDEFLLFSVDIQSKYNLSNVLNIKNIMYLSLFIYV